MPAMPPVPAGAARRDVLPDGRVGMGMFEWSMPAMSPPAAGEGEAADGVLMSIVEWSIPAIEVSFAAAPPAAPVSAARVAVVGAERGSSLSAVHDVSSSVVASKNCHENLIEWSLRRIR